MQDAKKQNAFVLYDLKNIGMLQGMESESSDGDADNNYAFDFSDDEEREI